MKTGEMLRTFRLLPSAFWVLAGGTFVNRFATFLICFLTLFTDFLGFTPAQGGVAVMMYSVGGLVCSFVAGPLAERYGRNRIMGGSLLLEALAVLSMAAAVTYPQILGVAFAAGFASMGSHPATAALVADIVPPQHRTAAQLALRLAINSGWAFGPMVAGFMAKNNNFTPLFIIDAISSASFGILCLLRLPRGEAQGAGGGAWMPAIREALRMRPLLALLLWNVLIAFVLRQLVTTYPLAMKRAGLGNDVIGIVQGLNGVLIIAVEIPLMAFMSGMSLRRGIVLGGALFGLSMLVLLGGSGLWLFVTAMLLLTLGEMVAFPRSGVYLANLSPVAFRARFAGMNSLAWIFGNLLGSYCGSILFERSPAALWWLCGALGIASAAVMLAGGRAPEAEAMARREHENA